jgi:hypothetical protein
MRIRSESEFGDSELGPYDRMPFGKHQGRMMKDVPDDYWEWMIHEAGIADGPVRRYILKHTDVS